MTKYQEAEAVVRRFAKRLRQKRHEQDLTVRGLASRVPGMSMNLISATETGRTTPTLISALLICEALGVTLEEMLRGET